MQRTRFGGSDALPRTPTAADPRSVVAQSKLDEDPRLARMWAGYAFAVDHREERGHAYMLDDQTFTGRQQKPQPGACVQCHASVVTAYRALGGGDLVAGFVRMNAMPYPEARTHVDHAIACIDCHEPATMRLRVTRPAFIEGIARVKAAEGVPDFDVNRDASRLEMRTFICAQCHVEYHFEGADMQLTYPWHEGRRADEILDYYDGIAFRDWQHAETGADMLKAQHPEFEMWSQGIHARAGVSCVDCHMPYKRAGAKKITDHHIRSPLLNIGNACQVCHPVPRDELLARAEAIQARTIEMQDGALDRLVRFIDDIRASADSGADPHRLDEARHRQRRASFLIDFVSSENSAGFHAPQEAARLLFLSMQEILEGTRALHAEPSSDTP
jgi:nitrite reductase (cytochrome c-552)